MRLLGVLSVATTLALALAVSASGQDPWGTRYGTPQRAQAPPTSSSSGRSGTSTSRVRPGSTRTLAKRCVTRRGVRTCRFYSRGRIVKVCTKRGKRKERCRRPAASVSALGPAAPAAPLRLQARRNSGYTNPIIPAVGRFYWLGAPGANKGWCSGTLVRRGLVLTAAHCLFFNRTDGHGRYGYVPIRELVFAPGNLINNGRVQYPYGGWQVVNTYVPDGWKAEDGGLDWGIAVIGANANGQYPGDLTGTFSAYWGATFPFGTRIYNVGYPASGPFGTAAWFWGNGQYFCDSRWDGETSAEPYFRSSYGLRLTPCEMNGGSSGGPVFVQFGDGSWGIIGVNNRGKPRADGFGEYGISFYFDNRFGVFWNSVLQQL